MKRSLLGWFILLSFFAAAVFAQEAKDAELSAPDGVKLKVTYYAAAKPGPAVILLHQCNRDRKTWNTLAPRLVAAGFHVLALDYRGYGESGGGPFASPQERQRVLAEKWPGDIDSAFAYLLAQPGVDKDRIGAAGASCGVNQSIQLAQRHPEVKTLVLLSGNSTAAGREYLRQSHWLPLFAAASDDDGDLVPSLRWVLSFSRNPKNKFVQLKAAGHGTDMFAVEKGLEPAIVDWFASNLRNAPVVPPAAATPSQGKPSPAEEFWAILTQPNGATRALQYFEEARKRDPNIFLFPESEVNALGYQSLQSGDVQEAIEIFKLNVVAYPRSANVYDSLADAYLADGNQELAIRYSEKALQVLAGDPSGDVQRRNAIRESAEGKLRQLRPRPPASGTTAAPPQAGRRDVELAAPDGVKLQATFFAAVKPGPGILLLHMCGNGGRKPWNNLAALLAQQGMNVLTLDYRGFGGSGGERFESLDMRSRRAALAKWPADFETAFEHLLSQPGVDKKRIGAAGASCGADNAVQLARRHPEVKSLVFLSGGTDQAGLNFLRQAEGLPIFAAASEDDFGFVPYMRWLLLFSRHPQNKLVEYKKAGHGTDMFAAEKDLEPMVVEWFVKTLRDAPAEQQATAAPVNKPSPALEFWSLLTGPDGPSRALQALRDARKRDPNVLLFPEYAVLNLGYERLRSGDLQGAMKVFQLEVEAYPNSAIAHHSLAAAYLEADDRQNAMAYTEKTLQLLEKDSLITPENKESIRRRAEDRLRQLKQPPAVAAPSPQASAPQPAPMPPRDQILRMPVVYTVPGMDQVQVRKDIVYKTVQGPGGSLELKMDAYIPAGAQPGQQFPAVLLINGGDAGPPDWRNTGVYQSYGRLLAASGFVGIPFIKRFEMNYEGLGQGESDIKDLVRYLQEHAAEFRIDPDRIALWAFSGGGCFLGFPLRDVPPYVRAVVAFYAGLDLGADLGRLPADDRARILERFSPLEQVKRNGAKVAPLLVARAGLDQPGLNSGIDKFVQAALLQNAMVEVLNHPTGRHAFDILDDNPRSREIIARAIEFLKARMGP